ARIAYGWGVGPWIAKRKHDGRGPMSKSALQNLGPLSETPGDEAAADPSVARALPFSVKPVAVAIPTAEQSQPACVADRRREPATRDEVHRSEQSRVLNSQRLCQTILNGHAFDHRSGWEQERSNCFVYAQRQTSPLGEVKRASVGRPFSPRVLRGCPISWPS